MNSSFDNYSSLFPTTNNDYAENSININTSIFIN